MPVYRRSPRSITFAGTHLYTWVERGTVRVKCLAREHKTTSPARARTRTARSGDERTKQSRKASWFSTEISNYTFLATVQTRQFLVIVSTYNMPFYCHSYQHNTLQLTMNRCRLGVRPRQRVFWGFGLLLVSCTFFFFLLLLLVFKWYTSLH